MSPPHWRGAERVVLHSSTTKWSIFLVGPWSFRSRLRAQCGQARVDFSSRQNLDLTFHCLEILSQQTAPKARATRNMPIAGVLPLRFSEQKLHM